MKFLLLPFSVLYRIITDFRNYLYDIGQKKSFKFETKVINVGNLTVGGTGKTPHVEYLIKILLEKSKKVATLSRGYGRKTSGFILADESATAKTIGDEPMQFYRKFGKEISVSVGEERAVAIPMILFEKPETEIIVLDDAFQHRPVKPDLNILLTDYNRLFYQDFVLPAGRLRESRRGAKRTDVVIVTKCPESATQEYAEIEHEIAKYTKLGTDVYFTGIKYGEPVLFSKNDAETRLKNKKILLVSGIAQPQILERYASSTFSLKKHIIFKDHHFYSGHDVLSIQKAFLETGAECVLTTEKDFVKLVSLNLPDEIPFFYLPIEISFLKDEERFQKLVFETINMA